MKLQLKVVDFFASVAAEHENDQEEEVLQLSQRITELEECILKITMENTKLIESQFRTNTLLDKEVDLREKNVAELLRLRLECENSHIRIVSAESMLDERTAHYKELIAGIRQTAQSAEESDAFLKCMCKLLKDYNSGQSLENSLQVSTRMCVICMSVNANVCAKPCNHLEWCAACAIKNFSLTSNALTNSNTVQIPDTRFKCTRCKENVTRIDYIFT